MRPDKSEPGKRMRADWDGRARGNWRYFVAAHACSSEEQFRSSGRQDYEESVRGFMVETNFDPSDKVALEVGCGVGRMTEFFARDFRSVTALDVSPEMLVLGRRRVPAANVLWVCGDGTGLSGIADKSADFVFCYKVLQHIREISVVANYLKEMARVTRDGGWVKFQVMNHPHLSFGAWYATLFISRRLRVPRVRVYKPDTFDAAPERWSEVVRMCQQAGLRIESVSGRWTQNAWLRCTKAGWSAGREPGH
jgi:ubiquinone/menaquinone biosynthesis C-methylase UbiE